MNPSEPTFRAHKRRKVYRRRDEDDDEQSPVTTSATSATTPQHLGLEGTNGDHEDGRAQEPGNFGTGTDQQVPNDGEDASTVHSQRKPISGKPIPGKPRRGGIAFSHNSRPSSLRQPSPDTSTTLVPTNGEAEQQPKASMLETARSRFAPQTGAAINEGGDAQMTAYIDAELDRRRRGLVSPTLHPNGPSAHTSSTKPSSEAHKTRQPAATGQIEEVHLPSNPTASQSQQAPRKERQRPPRLGRDGKPLPPRRRHRRGSEDMARDALVEAVMRENGLGVYESSPDSRKAGSGQTDDADGSGANSGRGRGARDEDDADAMVAAQFEREYLESLEAQRRPEQPKMPGPPPGPRMKGEIDLLRGPKLGGSRSARAAMHAAEKEREKGKGK